MTPKTLDSVVTLRMTAEDKAKLQAEADERGLKVGEFLRELALTPPEKAYDIQMGDASDPMMQALQAVAAKIVHCSDYGECYWAEATGDVWWEACDGDPAPADPNDPGSQAGTSFEDITSMFKAVEGVKTVTIEAEAPPPDDGSYVQVPQEEIASDAGDGTGGPTEGDAGDGGETADGPTGTSAIRIPLGDGSFLIGLTLTKQPESSPRRWAVSTPALAAAGAMEAPDADETGDSPEPLDPAEVTAGEPFRATLAIEGEATDDGRLIEKGALGWRELPLTLMAIIEDSHGGMPTTKTVVAGRIDSIERQENSDGPNEIIGAGVFDTGPQGAEIARLVKEKMMRGVSIDLAVHEYEERWGEDVEGAVMDPFFGEPYLMAVLLGTIMGATVCPFAAFANADIEITDGSEPIPAESEDEDEAAPIAASGMIVAELHEYAEDENVVTGWTLLGEFAPQEVADVPAKPDADGVLIALYPAEAADIADPDGAIPSAALHVTLFASVDGDGDAIAKVVDDFVSSGKATLSGVVGGAAVFGGETPGEEGEPDEGADSDADDSGGSDTPADGATPAAASGQVEALADAPSGTPADSDTGAQDVPQVIIVDAPGLGEMRFDLADALEAAGITYAEDHDFTPHITTDYDDAADMMHNMTLIGNPLTFKAISIVEPDGTRQDVPLSDAVSASAAGLAPIQPPGEWFEFPHDVDGFDSGEAIPLTVDSSGRVFGYAALFNECHIGYPGKCLPAPHHYHGEGREACAVCGSSKRYGHSRLWYERFHLGVVETAEGEMVGVGNLTMGIGHSDPRASMKQAMEHYDNPDATVADIRCYETPIGLVVAGAIRPDASALKVRQLRGAKLSGEWRAHKGEHEMIGVAAVNIPGYPVPRPKQTVKTMGHERQVVVLQAAGIMSDDSASAVHKDNVMAEVAREKLALMLRRARES